MLLTMSDYTDSMPNTLLLVEDDPAIAEALQMSLTQQGYQINWVGLGRAAVQQMQTAASQPIDLVILDVGLPDLNGFEVCRQIRKASAVPILFLTAHADEIDRIQGFEVGADDYIVKPFSLRELAARIRAILRRHRVQPLQDTNEQIVCGPLRNQIDQATIYWLDQPLILTRTEYLLLAHLMQTPRRVFTREQLLDAVQGAGSPTGDRAVDTHIKTLRAKLAQHDVQFDPIMTHRGFGYSLNLTCP
jgi:two-component system, OmpR family, catabolic regulation response regulator CreB